MSLNRREFMIGGLATGLGALLGGCSMPQPLAIQELDRSKVFIPTYAERENEKLPEYYYDLQKEQLSEEFLRSSMEGFYYTEDTKPANLSPVLAAGSTVIFNEYAIAHAGLIKIDGKYMVATSTHTLEYTYNGQPQGLMSKQSRYAYPYGFYIYNSLFGTYKLSTNFVITADNHSDVRKNPATDNEGIAFFPIRDGMLSEIQALEEQNALELGTLTNNRAEEGSKVALYRPEIAQTIYLDKTDANLIDDLNPQTHDLFTVENDVAAMCHGMSGSPAFFCDPDGNITSDITGFLSYAKGNMVKDPYNAASSVCTDAVAFRRLTLSDYNNTKNMKLYKFPAR